VAPVLSSNMEDYLEAIYRLMEDGGEARVKQIAEVLSVSLPSVTSALKTLREAGLVDHERYGSVRLSSEGRTRAASLHERHRALQRFLVEVLLVDAEAADVESCSMEHAIGPVTLERLLDFVRCVLDCPRHDRAWLGTLQARWTGAGGGPLCDYGPDCPIERGSGQAAPS